MPTEGRPAAFIDRDGVINADLGHVHRIEDFHVLPGVAEALRELAQRGYALVVVTNQAGIAKGLFDEAQYQRLTAHMHALLAERGVQLSGTYHCPHHPQGSVAVLRMVCGCRKPAPGLLLRAAAELGLSLGQSVLVGDKPSDTAAGRAAGVRATVLVRSGHPLPHRASEMADHVCTDLRAAASWICALPASPG